MLFGVTEFGFDDGEFCVEVRCNLGRRNMVAEGIAAGDLFVVYVFPSLPCCVIG